VPADWLVVAQHLQAVTLHCAAEHLGDEVLAEARANGMPVLCYTVNTEKAAKSLVERGVSAMFTDRLDLFVAETSAYKGLHLGG
jgi:glycerophosphoryl diester phosphodiesterase